MSVFSSGPHIAALYPGGLAPPYRARNVANLFHGVFDGPVEGLYAVLRTSSDDVFPFVALISSRVYRGLNGILDAMTPGAPLPTIQLPSRLSSEDKRRQFYERFLTWAIKQRMGLAVCQQPHVYVQVLGTQPIFRKQGAATRLLDWTADFMQQKKNGWYSSPGQSAGHAERLLWAIRVHCSR